MTALYTQAEIAELPVTCRAWGHDYQPAEAVVFDDTPDVTPLDRALRLHSCTRCGDEVRAIEMVPR